MNSSKIVYSNSKKLTLALEKHLRKEGYIPKDIPHVRYSGLISTYISEEHLTEPHELETKLVNKGYQFIKYDGWYEDQADLLQKLHMRGRAKTGRNGIIFFVYPQSIPERDTSFFGYLQGLSSFWQNLSDLRDEHDQTLAVFNVGDSSYNITAEVKSLQNRVDSLIVNLKESRFRSYCGTLDSLDYKYRYEDLFGKAVDQISKQALPFDIVKPMIERLSRENGITSYKAPVSDCFSIDQIIDTNRLRVFNDETFLEDELSIDFFSYIEWDRL